MNLPTLHFSCSGIYMDLLLWSYLGERELLYTSTHLDLIHPTHNLDSLSFTGVILMRFSCSSKLLPITFTQQNMCCIKLTHLRWNICQNRTSLDLVMVIGGAHLLISQLDTKVLPIVCTFECKSSCWYLEI